MTLQELKKTPDSLIGAKEEERAAAIPMSTPQHHATHDRRLTIRKSRQARPTRFGDEGTTDVI